MNVGVLFETSGVVRDAFIRAGHNAISYDLETTERPGPHVQGDVRNADLSWLDLAICHPPCTDLAVSGARYFAQKIADGRQQAALDLVRWCMSIPVRRIAIENPVSIISSRIRRPDQIIQPWQFGHAESKTTCLWLTNLPLLSSTEIVDPPFYGCCGVRFPFALGKYGCQNCGGSGKAKPIYENQTPSGQNRLGPSVRRATDRARTYEGIAVAMADQWGHATQAQGTLAL